MNSLILAAAVLLNLSALKSQQDAEREALRTALMQVIETSSLKNARVALQVQTLEGATVLYSQNADELLNPASNVKLFTSAAALVKLGPEFRFDTEFLVDADYRGGKTRTLYVRGKGDPSLNTERLTAIVAELSHQGLKDIQDIVLDETYFDTEREAPGFDQEKGDRAYLAPSGALSLNWNTVAVYIRPSDSLGAPAALEIEPMSEYFTTDGRVITGSRTQRRFNVNSVFESNGKQRISVSGNVPLDRGAWTTWKKIDAPAQYFGYTLKSMLETRGIKVRGKIKMSTVPEKAKMFYTAQSETLDLILKKLNKNSSNFVAEQLVKTLGAQFRPGPGSTSTGIDVIEEFLEKDVGILRGSFVMRNGSGLNDTNRFSAAQMTKLLKHMWARFPLAPEYLSALGIAGKDGTLKYRFEGTEAEGRLRAKTGTLENVSALAGYVQSTSGEKLVFSIIANDFPGRASTVVKSIDALGVAMAATGSAQGPGAAVAKLEAPSVNGSTDSLASKYRTYTAVLRNDNKASATFLRTSWRTERDPAVKVMIADAIYQMESKDAVAARLLLDTVPLAISSFPRLVKLSQALSIELPGFMPLVELAASGQQEAMQGALQYAALVDDGSPLLPSMQEHLSVLASESPIELISALRESQQRQRLIDRLAQGLAQTGAGAQPFWVSLRETQGSVDAKVAEFSRDLEAELSQKIAQIKSVPTDLAQVPQLPKPANNTSVVPGG